MPKLQGRTAICFFAFLLLLLLFFKKTTSVICFKNSDLVRLFFSIPILPQISAETNIDQYFLRMWLFKQRERSGSLKILVQDSFY